MEIGEIIRTHGEHLKYALVSCHDGKFVWRCSRNVFVIVVPVHIGMHVHVQSVVLRYKPRNLSPLNTTLWKPASVPVREIARGSRNTYLCDVDALYSYMRTFQRQRKWETSANRYRRYSTELTWLPWEFCSSYSQEISVWKFVLNFIHSRISNGSNCCILI